MKCSLFVFARVRLLCFARIRDTAACGRRLTPHSGDNGTKQKKRKSSIVRTSDSAFSSPLTTVFGAPGVCPYLSAPCVCACARVRVHVVRFWLYLPRRGRRQKVPMWVITAHVFAVGELSVAFRSPTSPGRYDLKPASHISAG